MERTPKPCPSTVVALRRHGSQYFERSQLEGSTPEPRLSGCLELFGPEPSSSQSFAATAGSEHGSAHMDSKHGRTTDPFVALFPPLAKLPADCAQRYLHATAGASGVHLYPIRGKEKGLHSKL
jgi:hypothetical protein